MTENNLFASKILWLLFLFCNLCLFGESQNSAEQNFTISYLQGDYPAASSFLPNSMINGIFRNDFCTREMMYKELNACLTKRHNTLLVSVCHYGYSRYGNLSAAIGYGRCFGNKLAISMRGFYLLKHAEHYSSQNSFTIDLSLCYQINAKFGLDVEIYNPIRMRYNVSGEEIIPMFFAIQCRYQPTEKLAGSLYVSKRLPGELEIGGKLLYHPIHQIFLSGNCTNLKLGLGIHVPWQQWVFSIESAWYYRTSFSTQCQLYYYIPSLVSKNRKLSICCPAYISHELTQNYTN